jgi:hypothetical protein
MAAAVRKKIRKPNTETQRAQRGIEGSKSAVVEYRAAA